MDDFNSVPRASDDVYGQDQKQNNQDAQPQDGAAKSDSTGMARAGDHEKKDKNKEDASGGSNVIKAARVSKTAVKAAGFAAHGVGQAAIGAVKGAVAVLKNIPTAIMAAIGGAIMAVIMCVIGVLSAVTPATDSAPVQPVTYAYRAAIGVGTSTDPDLISDLRRDSARRIYSVMSGFQVKNWPSDWANSEYNVTENYGSGDVTSTGTKKITYGLRPEQVFGVLGNWTTESGLDPTAVETISDEPWMIGTNKQWAMANDWVVDLWASDKIGNKTYFESNPAIHRNGIGLAQWTDTKPAGDPNWTYDVHNPGRNSRLMRYAKLYGMEYYSASDLNLDPINGHKGWNGDDWVKGDTTIEGYWYDLDVQLAFALDNSEMGDTKAQWLWDWAAKGAEPDCYNMSIFDADEIQQVAQDATNSIEDRRWVQNAWTQGSTTDPRTLGAAAGDESSGVYGISSSSGIHVGNYDAIGDGTVDIHTFHHPEYEIDGTQAPTRSEYYSTPIIANNPTTEEARKDGDSGPSYSELGGVGREVRYYVKNGRFEIKYKNTSYTGYAERAGAPGHLTSMTENEIIYNNGVEAVREAAKARAIDLANDYWEQFLKRYNPNRADNAPTGESYDLFSYRWASGHSHVVAVVDAFGVTRYYIVDHTGRYPNLHDWSADANALAQSDWIECFKFYYRQYLYEGMAAYYTAQFLCEYEGVPTGYSGRFDNAMEYFDMWWDLCEECDECKAEPNAYYKYGHIGVDIDETKDAGPNAPGDFEDWFFHIEQAYAQGIATGIKHTADELNDKQKTTGKIWEADQLMMNGKKEPYMSHKDLARAGCLIAWPTIADSTGNNGTELYQYINDSVIGDGIYMSCDRSVCTAVRWSGYDDNFPGGNTTTQLDYLVSSPNWVEIDWGGNVSMLQPGDIIIRKSYLYPIPADQPGDHAYHIVMYVGDWMADMNGKVGLTEAERASSNDVVSGSNIMHGSYGERSPGIGQFYDELRNYHVFRCMFPMAEGTSKYVHFHKDF